MRPEGQKILYNIVTIIAILAGLVGMVIGIAASPIFGSIFSLCFILLFGFIFGRIYLRDRKRKQLLANGLKAKGKIVEMWDTGFTSNNQPQIGMVIEVTPESEPSFKSEVTLVISRLKTSFYQVGVECIVRYDPNNKKTVAIESLSDSPDDNYSSVSTSSFFPGKTPQQIEDMIFNLNIETKRLITSGVECKATVKSIENTNVIIYGARSLNSLVLEIIPDNLPAYEAKCLGIIPPASIQKYEPGKQIWIKYDPADLSRVTLCHT